MFQLIFYFSMAEIYLNRETSKSITVLKKSITEICFSLCSSAFKRLNLEENSTREVMVLQFKNSNKRGFGV